MVPPDRQRLRIRQRQLKLACQFVHPHGVKCRGGAGRKKGGKVSTAAFVALLSFPRFSLPAPLTSVGHRVADVDDSYAQNDEDELADAGAGVDAAVEAGDQVGDGDVEEAGGGE